MKRNYKDAMSAFKKDIKERIASVRKYRSLEKSHRDDDWMEWKTERDEFLSKSGIGEYNKYRDNWYFDSLSESIKMRHMHIAYCLLRGRKLYQMEPKVREGNEAIWSKVKFYIEKYVGEDYEFMWLLEKYFGKKEEPKKPELKMYVLVRTDMHQINRAVQAGHAVAEYQKEHLGVTEWDNGYMIYLGLEGTESMSNEEQLNMWEARLKAAGIAFSTFVEPDWKVKPEPIKTAIAACDTGEIFKELPLLNMDDPVGDTVDWVITRREDVVE